MAQYHDKRNSRHGVVISAMVAMVAIAAFAAAVPAFAADTLQTEFVYIGSLQPQIHALRFDAATGAVTPLGTVAEGLRATWVEAHPSLPVLYAVDDDRAKDGSITAYAVNRASGALTRIDDVLSGGRGTTFLHFDAPSSTLLGANYNSGSVSSVAVNADGSVGTLASTLEETGSGPNPRQASAHAHGVTIDPSGRYALVPDFGADRIFIYRFDRTTHALAQLDGGAPHAFVMPPGSGPRRVAFGATGEYAYVLTELSAQVTVLRWDAVTATLNPVQTLSISSDGFSGQKSGAEMTLSHDGKFVYVENRGENSLVVYRVNSKTGELALVQRIASGGDKPWGFALDPSGKWLFVANQRSGNVSVFAVDTKTGTLANSGQSAPVADASSVTFVQ